MKTRTIKELLILMRDNIDLIGEWREGVRVCGLCLLKSLLLDMGLMSESEWNVIDDYMDENLPRNARIREQKYGLQISDDGNPLSAYWWNPYSKAPD